VRGNIVLAILQHQLCAAAWHRAAALKFYLYSQLEYVTAAMLTKYVPKGMSHQQQAHGSGVV
jgi:hypothetical protein